MVPGRKLLEVWMEALRSQTDRLGVGVRIRPGGSGPQVVPEVLRFLWNGMLFAGLGAVRPGGDLAFSLEQEGGEAVLRLDLHELGSDIPVSGQWSLKALKLFLGWTGGGWRSEEGTDQEVWEVRWPMVTGSSGKGTEQSSQAFSDASAP